MPYLAKLSHRLASARSVILLAAAGTSHCSAPSEVPDEHGATQPTSFVLTPRHGSVQAGDTIRFVAKATGSTGASVEVDVAYRVTSGTIEPSGLFTADTVPGQATVIASCRCGLVDTALVTVTAAAPFLTGLFLSPRSSEISGGSSQQFEVTATWSDGATRATPVVWSTAGGTVTSTGLYQAPNQAGSYQLTVRAEAGNLADTASISVTPPPSQTLRELAKAHGLSVATAVNAGALEADAQYRATLALQYDEVVPENAMKFSQLHPGPSQYDFSAADRLIAFAKTNRMTVHGHALVWHQALPTWIANGGASRTDLLRILKEHIDTTVGRYRGQVTSWDVVNEPVADDLLRLFRPTIWLNTIGPEYIDSAFTWAHRADPAAKLFLNEYGIESTAKADKLLALATGLRARGVPVDGIGFQTHFEVPTRFASRVRSELARFAAAGFQTRISELDVKVADGSEQTALDQQAAIYRDLLDACLATPNCRGFTTWGFTDRYSWLPQRYPGFGRGLPFDDAYQPKPAFTAMVARLQQP